MPIEKSVFISYRRTNIFHARAIFQDLRANRYDVFMDYESIDSGAFDQIILNQIKARAHFIVILTPSALERCVNPDDWLRREIETAIEYKRNIVPLMFEGFDWKDVEKYLVGKMAVLNGYNSLRIPSDFFDEAMNRLRTRFLNIDVSAVIHPTPQADKVRVEQAIQKAANQPVVTEKQLSAGEYLERGNRHYHANKYDAAIQDYNEAIRINPQYAEAYQNRGLAYDKKGLYTLAIVDYTEAILLNPQDGWAYHNRGVAYESKKDYDRAFSDYDEAIRLNPRHVEAYHGRANVYMNAGKDYNRAITDYTEAIRLNPQFVNAYVGRGLAYYNKKQYKRAIADYTEAIRLDPQNGDAYNNRGIVYENKRDYDRAIADYTEAIRLNPKDVYAYNNRGTAYGNKRDYDRALADYNRALQLDPNDEIAKSNRDIILRKKRSNFWR